MEDIVKRADNLVNTIFDVWRNYGDYQIDDILTLIHNIINFNKEVSEQSKENPYVEYLLLNALKDLKQNLGYCPECKEPTLLSTYTYREPHNEISEFGYNPYEEFSKDFCNKCGWQP